MSNKATTKKMNPYLERLFNGIVKENPTFVLMLGMCPTLAVTTSAMNGLGMGLTTTAVLILSNMLISALRKAIPDKVRMPAYIVVVATFVTMIEFLLKAYIPALNESLGIYIPLIVVNCIILGRAESYASKNSVGKSMFDGIGMGLGFTIGLTFIGIFREVLGNGTIFDMAVMPASYQPFAIFAKAPGAFFVLAMLTALQNKFKAPSATNAKNNSSEIACGGNCGSCVGSTCADNKQKLSDAKEADKAAKLEAAKKAADAKKKQTQEAAVTSEKE